MTESVEQHPIYNSSTQSPQKSSIGPWPWYALVITGFAISGFFPWLMVAWALYQRQRKRTAAVVFLCNFAVFGGVSWGLLRLPFVWWKLLTLMYLLNIVWALAAWGFQRKSLGSAPKRYVFAEWKSWFVPLLVGAVLGICLGTVFSIIPASQNRIEVWQIGETLERETILWDFFMYVPWGLAVGLLVGGWWAGEHKDFKTNQVITCLAALALTITCWFFLSILLFFLVHKGSLEGFYEFALSDWAVVPPWINGFPKFLLQFHAIDVSALLVVPLLFGRVSRLRDFGKQTLLIPLAFLCLLPRIFSENMWWSGIQDQIMYEMSSPEHRTRASAHRWAALLLRRYPNHMQWPAIAQEVAQYYYEIGEYEKAQLLYQDMVDHYNDSNQWYWHVTLAREALLNTSEFGISPSGPNLEVPVVDYEEYLSFDWMAVLSVIRYWENSNTTDSEIKIKLKTLSLHDDMISLGPIENFADLDDVAENLGYDMVILPANFERLKNLIAAGFPILHQRYTSWYLIWGIDESRGIVSEYAFEELSYRIRREAPKEAGEILEFEEEGHGESRKRLLRITNEVHHEHAVSFWEDPALQYIGPLMAVVFPPDRGENLAAIADSSWEALKAESDGYLATLISLSYAKNADPVQAVEWAKVATQKLTVPLPLYAAHVARTFWESRKDNARSTLPLQEQFAELDQFFAYFDEPENIVFLDHARQQFESALTAGEIPWSILRSYLNGLDRSEPDEFMKMIQIIENCLTLDPESSTYWSWLADIYEWDGNIAGMVEALQGMVSVDPIDFQAKLRLMYGYVLLDQYAEAKTVLETIDPGQIVYDADYAFCLGAIAEAEGEVKQALNFYALAVEMRRHKPIYHLKYGKLLLREGEVEKAKKALEWAARIDAGEEIQREAERLLATM